MVRQHRANCFINGRPKTALSCCRSSVCRLSSVTLVHPTQAVEIFGNFSTAFGTLASIDIHEKFYRDCPTGTPSPGELNTRGVVKCSDFGPIEGYISETVQDRRYLSVNYYNRKSYMSFRVVSKSVTLNGLEWRNGGYFALFQRIWQLSGRSA